MYNSPMNRKSKHEALTWAHPIISDWFLSKFGSATPPQVKGWPSILAHQPTLISAPTGSGKTLAAFLACLNDLVTQSVNGTLQATTQIIYVSPLKALSNDIHKNLLQPLRDIEAVAKQRNQPLQQEIRVAVRTGDTLPRERQAMLKTPPHILVTTPESLYILLTAEKSRALLTNVHTVIVDEIHAIADDKRGAHLALTLERLEALTTKPLNRIGLSATQKPIEKIASFLVGIGDDNRRQSPFIVQMGHQRQLDLGVVVPASELGPIASNEMWDEIYDQLATLARQHKSTLIFVNTRRLAERVAHHLSERLGEDQVAAHHGSLSRKIRLNCEAKLKNGEYKALVATASLELGIDIGAIDLVCQIGSPRAIATALQRVGRASHFRDAISKGRFFATTRDELTECAALVYAIKEGELDQLIIPKEPLDILCQQIVAICASGEMHEDDLFALVKHAYPYQHLNPVTFNNLLAMLSNGIAGSRGRFGAYLLWDRVNKIVKARRGARITAILNGGAIPENGLFTVIAEPHETVVGTLDEDFAVESNRGDIILLGSTSWQIKRVESKTGKVRVEDAHGAPPSVPFWRGEAPARTQELSAHVAIIRNRVSQFADHKAAVAWLQSHCGLDQLGADELTTYIESGRAVLGAVPTQETIIAERFFDESGGMQLVIHSPYGARINKAWGLALRKCFCRSFNFELQATATDDGVNIALAEQHSFPLADVFNFVQPETVKKVLIQTILQLPLFNTRFRWVATRSLTLPRFRFAKKVPPNILRMLADDMLAAVFPEARACQDNLAGREITLPDHPLVDETIKDVLTEALDIDGFMALLQKIQTGEVTCLAVDTTSPSVFAHEILNANPYAYLDDAPLEERRARAVEMRRILPETTLQEIGYLNPEVILEVKRQIWPDVRTPDELHDILQTLIALPPEDSWQTYFDELLMQRRVGSASVATSDDDGVQQTKTFWFAVEKFQTFAALYPQAILHASIVKIDQSSPSHDDALLTLMRGWLQCLGPCTAKQLHELLGLPVRDFEQAFLILESSGFVLRGQFTTPQQEYIEWCERRILARIHRYTLGQLRKEIAPVTAAQFMTWLLRWQHLAPGTQLSGEQGLIEALKQLQGFEIPANAWEKQILPKRVKDYRKDMLDNLCLRGQVGWGRLSTQHDAAANMQKPNKKRIIPTSVAPITFFVREDASWLFLQEQQQDSSENLTSLSHQAQKIYHYLKTHGASFFPDIVRDLNALKAEIENGLWELVTAGFVTADGFDNLRSLIDPKRRLRKHGRRRLLNIQSGRWYLLHPPHQAHNLTSEENAKYHESICWMLLKRYGVVFRDIVVREKNIPRWRELLVAFRRLEGRGEVRGGRFVSGFLGEQFALPYAVESLRAMRKEMKKTEINEITIQGNEEKSITIAATDPTNLIGIILPGQRVTPYSGRSVTLPYLA